MLFFNRITLTGILALITTLGMVAFLAPPTAYAEDFPAPKAGKTVPEAHRVMDQMIAVYTGMKSYSGTTKVEAWLGQEPKPTTHRGETTIFMQRPNRIAARYKLDSSESGLAVYDGTYLFVRTSRHKTEYIKRNVRDTMKKRLGEHFQPGPYHYVGIAEALMHAYVFSRGLDVLLANPDFTYNDPLLGPYISLSLGQPGVVEGIPVNIVVWEIDQAQFKTTVTYFIDKKSHLLRRTIFVQSFKGKDNKMTQTHTNIQINAKLSASTFTFTPPRGAKPVRSFTSKGSKSLASQPGV